MEPGYPVVVVGGGVFGCAVAYELAKRAVDVLLIDKQLPGRATSASAGGLWPLGESVGLGCGVIYSATHGDGEAAPGTLPAVFRDFLIESNRLFPELAEELLDCGGVDIEYAPGPGLLFGMYEERERAVVDTVVSAMPDDSDVTLLTRDEILRLDPKLAGDFIGGALLTGEHQVNPMFLAEAYKRGAMQLGATFRGDCEVTGLRRHGNRVVGVELDTEFIPAETVVNAAGCWAGRLAASCGLELPVFPVRGQVVLTESLPSELSVCLSTAQCYLLQKQHGEVLIGSTTENVEFDTRVTQQAIGTLCAGAVRAIPSLRHVRVKRVWAGLRPGTPDELPFLGPVDGLEGYVNATGGFRTGIVASPLTGHVIAQSIVGESTSVPIGPFTVRRVASPAGVAV